MSQNPTATPTLVEKPTLTVEQQNRLQAFRAMTTRWRAEWEALSADEQAKEIAAYERAMKGLNENPLSLRDSVIKEVE